jgi:hypothetical protein
MKKIGKRETILSLLKDLDQQSLQPDEFTVHDYFVMSAESGRKRTKETAGKYLNSLVKNGQLNKRKVVINGVITNAYSKKNDA